MTNTEKEKYFQSMFSIGMPPQNTNGQMGPTIGFGCDDMGPPLIRPKPRE
jgi:hypothetical protein